MAIFLQHSLDFPWHQADWTTALAFGFFFFARAVLLYQKTGTEGMVTCRPSLLALWGKDCLEKEFFYISCEIEMVYHWYACFSVYRQFRTAHGKWPEGVVVADKRKQCRSVHGVLWTVRWQSSYSSAHTWILLLPAFDPIEGLVSGLLLYLPNPNIAGT